jgi:tetratricopeptide (TPR) repeat protein
MSEKVNPYDWTREILDPRLFAGRGDELDLIEKNIVALGAGQLTPYLAIVGERRVGKSSLLGRAQEIAQRHNLIPTRVELSVTTACNPWEFWRELFHTLTANLSTRGISCEQASKDSMGFKSKGDGNNDTSLRSIHIQFDDAYQALQSHTGTSALAGYIVINDLKTLCEAALGIGCKGILLMIDEAHYFQRFGEDGNLWPLQIKQHLKQALRETRNCGLIFAGEPDTGAIFNNSSEPLFGQGQIIPLGNFMSRKDIAECALQPLNEQERPLMSPMTIDYLARLSRGKPNQIRLICRAIYDRYCGGKQDNLDISIDVLDDIIEILGASLEFDLSKQVNTIRSLSSVDLEILHNMTRYPNWSVDQIVGLDESFRGDARSALASSRRKRMLEQKKEQFISAAIMLDEPERFILAGTEFLYLYLRFWYEIQKYGRLSRRLILGEIPHLPFSEKTDKLVRSIAWELRQGPGISSFIFHSNSREASEVIINQVRERFSLLESLSKGEKDTIKGKIDMLSECLTLSELVRKSGPYYLLCLTIRNLEIPRELMQVELYFESSEIKYIDLPELMRIINQQASEARILVEGFDLSQVNLFDLPSMLSLIGGLTLDDTLKKLDVVGRWHIAAIRHILEADKGSKSPEEGSLDKKEKEWIDLYEKGETSDAEESLNQALSKATERYEIARIYNDRGYIRYSLKKQDLARQDLERALDLHYTNLTLTLLNLGFIDAAEDDHETSIRRAEEALFLTLGREQIKASYLRVKVPECALGYRQIWEHKPANVLEAAYINLAYSTLMLHGVDKTLAILDEGLSLLPSSARVKHAFARFHLFRKQAPMATPIYQELSQTEISDKRLLAEVNQYLKISPPRRRKRRK